MDGQTPQQTDHRPAVAGARARRRRWLRPALAVLGAGAIVSAVVLGRSTLTRSLAALGSLDFTWFVAAVACEIVSLTAFGLSRRKLLRADGHQVRFGSVMGITYAGNALSMSVPFAGAELAVVFSFQQFRRRGLDPALTGWALAFSAIASSSALALILLAGALAGGAPVATALGFLLAAVFGIPALTVALALRYPRARAIANRILARAIHLVRRLTRRPVIDPEVLEHFLHRLGTIRLGWRGQAGVFGLAVLNWLADCACLACAIRATGVPVPWQGLILAYGAGAAVGSTGITPGGFVVVEATLTAALVAAGMDSAHALTAVLAYRLVNFWMILAGGGGALVFLTRKREHQVPKYAQAGGDGAPRADTGAGQPPGRHEFR